MSDLDRRLTRLEKERPAVVSRAPDESIEQFVTRMTAALDRTPLESGAIRPWLAAMTHDELHGLADAMQASIDLDASIDKTHRGLKRKS